MLTKPVSATTPSTLFKAFGFFDSSSVSTFELYEEYRRSSTSQSRRIELDTQMKNLSNNVSDPKGVYSIISYS